MSDEPGLADVVTLQDAPPPPQPETLLYLQGWVIYTMQNVHILMYNRRANKVTCRGGCPRKNRYILFINKEYLYTTILSLFVAKTDLKIICLVSKRNLLIFHLVKIGE